jgi:hypothetical protein
MISEENKKVILKRFKSLIWKILGMLAAYALAFIYKNLTLLEIPEIYQILGGLIISEVSKYYNINLPKLKAAKKIKKNK